MKKESAGLSKGLLLVAVFLAIASFAIFIPKFRKMAKEAWNGFMSLADWES